MKGFKGSRLSLAATLLVVAAVLAACAPAPSPAAKPTAPAPAPATTAKPSPAPAPAPTAKPSPAPKPAAPKPTGTVRVALTNFFTENFGANQVGALSAVAGVYEFLVNLDYSGKFIPMLAERWEISPDAKTWTYYLRKGVQFHDGWGEMTAEDVKFSVEEGSKKGSLNTRYTNWARNLASIEVVNPYQIVFHFKAPYINMLSEAGPGTNAAVIVSKKYYAAVGAEKASQRPVGTGPFKFVEHKLGDTVRLQAMEKHWRATPGFEFIIYKLVPEETTIVQMLKAGDIDIASISPASIDQLKAAGFSFPQVPGLFAFYIGLGGLLAKDKYPKEFDPKIPWVGDPANPASLQNARKVRQALALAVDRESILRNLIKGAGSVSIVPNYQPGDPWTDPAWKPIPYDPAKAKQLLTEAGYPSGLQFDLWTYPSTGRPELPKYAEAVAMMWQQIGVKATIRTGDSASVKGSLLKTRAAGYAAFTESVPRNDYEPLGQYTIYFQSKGTYYYGIEDPRLDALQAKITAEPNAAKRYVMEKERGQLFIDNSWIIPGVDKNLVYAVSPKVQWKPYPAGTIIVNLEYATPKN